MCVPNPIPFYSDAPIIAYKVMRNSYPEIESLIAGNRYEIGKEYGAGEPFDGESIVDSQHYDKGFHAYENLRDAKAILKELQILVEVELSELTFRGTEVSRCYKVNALVSVPVLVANKCKFVKVIKVCEHVCH